MARLFFALWPDDAARAALSEHAQRLAGASRGRAVDAARLHLTLVFLGAVDAGGMARARRAAEAVRGGRFRMILDVVGGFRRTGVGWAGCREVPAALQALQSALALALSAEGYGSEARPWIPHLTLVRRMAEPFPREDIAPVAWEVGEFALVETLPGSGSYATRAAWPLGERRD